MVDPKVRREVKRLWRNRVLLGIGFLGSVAMTVVKIQSVRSYQADFVPQWRLDLSQSIEQLGDSGRSLDERKHDLESIRALSKQHDLGIYPVLERMLKSSLERLQSDLQLLSQLDLQSLSQSDLQSLSQSNLQSLSQMLKQLSSQSQPPSYSQLSSLLSSLRLSFRYLNSDISSHLLDKLLQSKSPLSLPQVSIQDYRKDLPQYPIYQELSQYSLHQELLRARIPIYALMLLQSSDPLLRIDEQFQDELLKLVQTAYKQALDKVDEQKYGSELEQLITNAPQRSQQFKYDLALLIASGAFLLVLLVSLRRLNYTTSLSFTGQLICFIPEECVAELEALRQRLIKQGQSQVYIRRRLLTEFIGLLLGLYLRSSLDNLFLPPQGAERRIDDD